jgi:hypothetical protein
MANHSKYEPELNPWLEYPQSKFRIGNLDMAQMPTMVSGYICERFLNGWTSCLSHETIYKKENTFYDSFIYITVYAIVNYLKTGQICPVFEWLKQDRYNSH